MLGENLASQAQFAIVEQGKPERVTEFLNNALASAEHYVASGQPLGMMAAEEDIAHSMMFARGDIKTLIATLDNAKKILKQKLSDKQFGLYEGQVVLWLMIERERIISVINASSSPAAQLGAAVTEIREQHVVTAVVSEQAQAPDPETQEGQYELFQKRILSALEGNDPNPGLVEDAEDGAANGKAALADFIIENERNPHLAEVEAILETVLMLVTEDACTVAVHASVMGSIGKKKTFAARSEKEAMVAIDKILKQVQPGGTIILIADIELPLEFEYPLYDAPEDCSEEPSAFKYKPESGSGIYVINTLVGKVGELNKAKPDDKPVKVYIFINSTKYADELGDWKTSLVYKLTKGAKAAVIGGMQKRKSKTEAIAGVAECLIGRLSQP
ncbi:MAG: hypothetical protein V1908_03785 [Candidatus Peregrinibacteria bacterium]